jgi:hypothetical protein
MKRKCVDMKRLRPKNMRLARASHSDDRLRFRRFEEKKRPKFFQT